MSIALPLAVTTPIFSAIASFLFPRIVGGSVAVFLAALNVMMALWLAEGIRSTGVQRHPLGGWGVPLGIDLHADGISALMVLLTATVGFSVSIFSSTYFPHSNSSQWTESKGFWSIWFLLWGSLNAVFLVADLFSIYVCLELITLSAVALIMLKEGMEAKQVALRYLLIALVASLAYLVGVALVYGETNVLDFELVSDRLKLGWSSKAALSLMTAGLMAKTALFPLHFWLPGAHSRAPTPVSAILSGLVVKSSFYVLFRLWIQVFPGAMLSTGAHLLGAFGSAAILWGSFRAIRQERIKLIIAYSTVAQIGYLFLAFPLLLSVPIYDLGQKLDAWKGCIYFALSHGIAKAALFLVSGMFVNVFGTDHLYDIKGAVVRLPEATLTWGLAGISLIGLPPSGGFIAKWLLLTSAIRGGLWVYAVVILIGGLLASGYVFRVLWFAFLTREEPLAEKVVPVTQSLAVLLLGIIILWMGLRAADPLTLLQVGFPFTKEGRP